MGKNKKNRTESFVAKGIYPQKDERSGSLRTNQSTQLEKLYTTIICRTEESGQKTITHKRKGKLGLRCKLTHCWVLNKASPEIVGIEILWCMQWLRCRLPWAVPFKLDVSNWGLWLSRRHSAKIAASCNRFSSDCCVGIVEIYMEPFHKLRCQIYTIMA